MFSRKFIQVGDCRTAYYDEGRGAPILFIHGIPTSSYLWRKVIDKLRTRYRCLAPDLLGLGHTKGPIDSDYGMPAQANRMAAFLDALGIKKAAVVAHDQGGAAGQILAMAHPSRVSRLGLINCVCYDNWPVPVIKALALVARLRPLAHLTAREPFARLLAHSRFGLSMGVHDRRKLADETIDAYIGPLIRDGQSRERFRRFVLAGDCRSTEAAAREFPSFKKPVVVAWAIKDRFLSIYWARRLAEDFPNSKLLFIEEGGHFIQEEKPEEVAHAVITLMQFKSR